MDNKASIRFNQSLYNHLIKEILERHTRPEDVYEIAATLESMGWNDQRATKEFHVEDIFELAAQMWDTIHSKISYATFATNTKPTLAFVIWEMIRSFLRGLIFAFPMAVSVASMLILRYSLWSYENLSVEQATAIAIGTILSFITVGGFTQAIARRGFFYIIQGYYNLAQKTTFLFIRIGFLVCIGIMILVYFSNVIFNFFPYKMFILIVLFFFFLNAIWLSVTVMYILKKELIFTGLIIFGILIVFLLFEVVSMDIIVAQVIALFLVSVISILLVLHFFKRETNKLEKGIALKLPRISITFYSVAPYFFYGFLYFSFLFVDRVNAWSANEEYMPYVIWFRGSYELGLDFALITLMIPMGVSEVIVNKLMMDIEDSQKDYLAIQSQSLYKSFLHKYYRMFGFIVLFGVISAFLVYNLSQYYNQLSISINDQNLLASEITTFVFQVGTLSYVILSICLMNAVILFALSQPKMVIRSILPAFLLNLLVGFLLSRWFHYQYAVYGLLIGSIYMSVVSTYYVRKVLNKIDYYLYAAS
jgi:hypothetical protein